MSNDAGGFGPTGPPPPGYPPPGYPPPAYQDYPPSGYAPPGYQRLSTAGVSGLPATGLSGLRAAAGLSAAGVRTAGLRGAATSPAGPQAGRHPVATAEPVRHLQRGGRLHPGQPEGHAGPDHHCRGGHPNHRADPASRSAGRHGPARAGAAWRGSIDGGASWIFRVRHCRQHRHRAVGDPAERDADRRDRAGGVRGGHHHRRSLAAAPRPAACVDRLHRAGSGGCDRAARNRGRHHRRRRLRRERRRGILHRRAAGPGVDHIVGLPRHDAQLRTAVDRSGTTWCHPRDRSVVRTGQERLLAGARHQAAGHAGRRGDRRGGVGAVQLRRPIAFALSGIHRRSR